MAYQSQSLSDFYCRKCNNQNPGSLSMSWVTDDLICSECKSEERNLPYHELCKEVERMTLSSYDLWKSSIILEQSFDDDELYIGEYRGERFLFKATDDNHEKFMFIKILKED